jgi:enterochelin esterase-like enzyme
VPPAGYSKEEGRAHPYPVLYCNDGQNVFGDCQTLSGNSWRVAQAAAEAIHTGRLPPFLVVALDHAGPLRSLEYTPYTPGTGPGGFRWVRGTHNTDERQQQQREQQKEVLQIAVG